jgi:uncharacterized membrane protein YkoI
MMRALIFAVLIISGAGITSASAENACFSAEDTREHVEKHGLIALHDVVRSARGTGQADLISARLCETNGNMVYMIAMLGRDGKLLRLTVDARTGTLINSR